jgi:arabinose-5-phosphate isomerase
LERAAEVLRLEASTIAGLEALLGSDFERAVDLVLACQGHLVVAGVGKAGLVGQKLSATFASTGTPSLFLHPTEALHGDLGRVRSRDVLLALSNSGESAETNQMVAPARRMGVQVIAITAGRSSTLARLADCVLEMGEIEEACPLKLAPTASTSAMMALGDALAMVVSQERRFGREEYALYHPGGMLGRKLMRVAEVMRSGAELPLVEIEATLAETILVMNRTPGRPGAALVVDGQGLLKGIFTHGDLARLLESHSSIDRGTKVRERMGKSPKSVQPAQLVEDAMRLMTLHHIDQIAVIDEAGRAVGLVDVQDLLEVRL